MNRTCVLTILSLLCSVRLFAISGTAGRDTVCIGATTSLTNSSAGGTWSSSAPTVATVGTDGAVTGMMAGTALVLYSFGSSIDTALVTVLPPPTVTISVSPGTHVCWGIPVTFHPVITGGTFSSCYWTLYGSYVGSGDTFIYNPSLCDSINCVVTGISTCSGNTFTDTSGAVHMFVMRPMLTVSGRDSICIGDHDTLIAHCTETVIPQWTNPTSLSCILCDTTIASPWTSQVYTVIAMDSLGCIDSAVFSVVVNLPPIVTITPEPATICIDSSLQLTASGAVSYYWYPAIGLSCTSCANPVASPPGSMAYTVVGTNSHGGCAHSAYVAVTVDSCTASGVPLTIYPTSQIYPNPATTFVAISSSAKITTMSIINLLGQTVYTHEYSSEKVQVDVSALPAGVYFVKINGTGVRKFIKE